MPIYEFPITIADEPPLLTDCLHDGIKLAKKIARHGGLCFSWFGTIEDCGRFWEARDAIGIDAHWQGGKLIVHGLPQQTIEGLPLIMPPGDASFARPAVNPDDRRSLWRARKA